MFQLFESNIFRKLILFGYKSLNIDGFKQKFPNNYQTFIANKIIIEDNVNELYEIRLKNKLASFYDRNFELTVLPTLDCNLHCWYCFEDHVPNSRMSKNVQERIVKHIHKKVENREVNGLLLEYFGGEPLLDFNEVAYPLGMSLKSIFDMNKLPFNSFFITNGTLIDDEMIEKLAELNAGFQITLDGNRDRHNKIRFNKLNHHGTYDHIVQAIYNLTERIDNTYVNIRINYDEKTLQHINELLNDLSSLNRRKVGIHFERVWQTASTDNNDNSELNKIVKLFIANEFSVSYINWHPRGNACKAERINQLAVNYDGKVFKCTGRKFTDEQSDGELDENGDVMWKPGRLEQRIGNSTFESHMCLNCKMLPICMGPCSQKQIEVGADRLNEVCTLNTLEMKMNEYIEYTYNNMAITQKIRS